MKKKVVKKSSTQKKAVNKPTQGEYIHIISVSFAVILVVLIGIITVRAVRQTHVLGMTSGPHFLADQGGTDQGGDTQGDTSNNTTSQTQNNQDQNKPSGTDTHPSGVPQQGHTEIHTDGNKSQVNIENAGTHIEMKKEDNGAVKISAHNADGTEVQLQSDSLSKINESLKQKDVQIGTNSAEGFTIKAHGVEAETHFPLSINPTTDTLSVTTPAGTKAVTVLPNQAVQTLLQHQILSSVSQTTASGTATPITLTQVNNQPAFAVQGTSNKKLLGIFPVSLNKTVYVSAQTGTILQTQLSFIDQLLNALSF